MLYAPRFASLPLLSLLLVACAADSTSPSENADTSPSEVVVCAKEEPTSSRLKVKRCWTRESTEQEERDAEAVLKRSQTVRPTPKAPGAQR